LETRPHIVAQKNFTSFDIGWTLLRPYELYFVHHLRKLSFVYDNTLAGKFHKTLPLPQGNPHKTLGTRREIHIKPSVINRSGQHTSHIHSSTGNGGKIHIKPTHRKGSPHKTLLNGRWFDDSKSNPPYKAAPLVSYP
jgi:hypothetical protein